MLRGAAAPAIQEPPHPGHPGAAVSLLGLHKHYGGVGAVRGISLQVRSGEFLTLLGPSGSGKTTTLMMLAGFETPTAGDITLDGRSIVSVPPNKRNLGMVFQNYALFPHLTVAGNIGFPLKQRGVNRATRARLVGDALDIVRLPGYGARYPKQLSGGPQPRHVAPIDLGRVGVALPAGVASVCRPAGRRLRGLRQARGGEQYSRQ